MFKRARWFSVGVVVGAGSAMYGFVRLRETSGRLAPDRVAETMVGTARTVGRGARRTGGQLAGTVGLAWRDAVAESRDAIAEGEAQILADLDRPRSRNGGWPPAQ
jgi:hypothetical protein